VPSDETSNDSEPSKGSEPPAGSDGEAVHARDPRAQRLGERAATLLAAVPLGALLFFVAGRCLVPMDETDLFFNLRLGEIVLRTHQVPLTNLLSFTWTNYRDVNLAWLFQILLALTHRLGGVPATVILKTTFVLATVAVLWRVGRRRGAHPALLAAALALAAWAAEPRFVERPHLVTFLGLALTLLALERAEAGRRRALWALVPAGLVWANANSCFFLAPAILLLYAAGAGVDRRPADARRAALVAAALAPLILATPSGTAALGYIANHLRMPSLRPLQEYRAATWPLDGPFFFQAAALAAAIALAPRGRWRTFLPALALGLLGWRRIRFVAEFALLAAPAIAAALTARLGEARIARLRGGAWPAMAVGGLLAILTVAPRVADARAGRRWLDLRVESGLVPEPAIRFAEREGLRDRMYNDLEVGSYLTWDGWPRFRVFQDPRINGYPDEFHAILRRADLPAREWQALLDRFGVTSALITYPAVNPRAALFDPARWALVYRGADALIFAARSPERAARIAALEIPLTFHHDDAAGLAPVPLPEPPAGSPVGRCEWSLRLGDFFLEGSALEGSALDRGGATRARASYRAGAACLDTGRRVALAALELQLGDAAEAARLLAPLSDPDSRVRRGYALLGLGRADEAIADFDAALDGPAEATTKSTETSADATLGRALALEALGRTGEAITALGDFLRRAPGHVAAAEARAHLARLAATAR
jgi:tetratricopeptide (TPR) repeat protein